MCSRLIPLGLLGCLVGILIPLALHCIVECAPVEVITAEQLTEDGVGLFEFVVYERPTDEHSYEHGRRIVIAERQLEVRLGCRLMVAGFVVVLGEIYLF